ncbi:FtsX-like permease family protein [Streptomyces lancefieldiae]|uniref:FtsX-like permease family protein n=1 Tax=Streptomyces lancefieldiae TaxID=3075520 RepID=A0ABU3ARI4_9ACTN|nr:FtsX-like permease family protein [Streptomyces sp. DSM 40712]MDT0612802.1 FtsX-like permease family protein [Streptomyces sp. DSM 40712]
MNSGAVPWVRTRLRAAPGAAGALALLVALTACLAAAFPRALDRYADAGLGAALEQGRPDRTSVLLTAPQPEFGWSMEQRQDALRPGPLGERYAKALAAVDGRLVVDRARSTYGVRTTRSLEVPEPWLPRPSGLPPQFFLAAQHGLGDHAGLSSGRLPRAPGAPVTAATDRVEAVVTTETARSLRIKVGSVLHIPGVVRAPLTVHVTGVLAPRDRDGAYWATQPALRTPALKTVPGSPDPNNDKYWVGTLLLAPDAAPALLGTAGNPLRYWQLAPDTAALHARDLGRLSSAVAALETGPGLREVRSAVDPATDVSTDLDEVFASFEGLRSSIGPLIAVAFVGAATVAGVVLLMAGGLAADRRRAELALLRARGASLPGLAGRLLAETAVVALPAGALGLAAALLALPGGRPAPAVGAAVAVTVVACAGLPLRAAVEHRTVRVHGGRQDVASVRPSRRRTVAELTAVALALGAVETLRRRGATGSAGDLVSLAPVLVGVIAALVLVRLYPLPLRRLTRPAGRLRGAVGHLALARAGRTSASAVLPLLALLTALTTAAFGGSVLAGVADARDRAALLTIGADARIEATGPLPSGLPGRVRGTSGVREVTEVGLAYQAKTEDGRETLPLAGVDPATYAALAARTGMGAFPADDLKRRGGPAEPLRALVSPAVAERFGTEPFPMRLEDGTSVTLRAALVRDLTPAVTGDAFLVVDRAGLSAEAARPTVLLLTGDHLDTGALRRATGDAASLHLRSEDRARYVDSPLQSGAERVYTAAVAAGAGYAVLALLLSLLRAAPERAALLARLRTMGLTRSQGRRLLVLESLPLAVPAAAGGALTGWATVRLLSPGIDLTTIALATTSSPVGRAQLRTDPWSLAVPAVAVLVVAVGVAGVQAWWSGRRASVTELRAGDTR